MGHSREAEKGECVADRLQVRCPDVNWRDRWDWGLYLLNATGAEKGMSDGEVVDDDADNPYAQPQQAAYSQREPGQDALVFLRDIHLSSKEADVGHVPEKC